MRTIKMMTKKKATQIILDFFLFYFFLNIKIYGENKNYSSS